MKCGNGRHQSINDIRSHLICHEIIPNYTKWIWHGKFPDKPSVSHTKSVDVDMGYRIEDMIHKLGQDGFQQAHAPLYAKIENDSTMPLYPGCTDFRRSSVVLPLDNLKTRFGWSDI